MMALPSLWVASGEAPAKESFANVHYRRAFLLQGRKPRMIKEFATWGRKPVPPGMASAPASKARMETDGGITLRLRPAVVII
jgi:hypothetical protein